MPLCLWEISNGPFDQVKYSHEYEATARAWGYISFEEFLG